MLDRVYKTTASMVTLTLILLPACGRDKLSVPTDSGLGNDLAADRVAPREDTLPLGPDLGPDLVAPDRAPDNTPLAPDLLPDLLATPDRAVDRVIPADIPPSRDIVPFDINLPDLRDVAPVEVASVDARDVAPDLPRTVDLAGDKSPVYDAGWAPDEVPPKPDRYVSLDDRGAADYCTTSGGTVDTRSCCSSVADFADTCGTSVGSCGCSPTNSHTVSVCTCPNGGCFLPGYGCVGPASTCTVGGDQTCNDSLIISSIHGRCVSDGRCLCVGYALSATSGKCL